MSATDGGGQVGAGERRLRMDSRRDAESSRQRRCTKTSLLKGNGQGLEYRFRNSRSLESANGEKIREREGENSKEMRESQPEARCAAEPRKSLSRIFTFQR